LEKYRSLISAEQTKNLLDSANIAIIDCRYDLFDQEKGKTDYLSAHIPGAYYAHLKHDLAGPIQPGITGRHPLPDVSNFSKKLSSWGIDEHVQVIAYDTDNGAMAARLWWLLKWLGHENVAVLDGGFEHWKEQKYPVTDVPPKSRHKEFKPRLKNELLVDSKEMENYIQDSGYCIIDSRSEERYMGKTEPIDPIAGHIPTAVNRFYMHNLNENKLFKSRDLLNQELTTSTNKTTSEKVVFYCGSGVTGAHNVLAHYHAGLGMPKLYAGSWSEWIGAPERPITIKIKEVK